MFFIQMHVQHIGVLPEANAPMETRPCECTATEPAPAPAPAPPSAPALSVQLDTTELAAVPGTIKGDLDHTNLTQTFSGGEQVCNKFGEPN